MKPSLTIIGNGFVGSYFLKQYSESFSKIITTSKRSKKHPRSTHHYNFDFYNEKVTLPTTDIAILSIPFSRQLTDPFEYEKGMISLKDNLKKYKKVIFLGSTSIYPLANTTINENHEIDNSKRANTLANCEQFLLKICKKTFILRLGGICGYERNSQKKINTPFINNANLPVNLIHVDDIIQFIMTLINHDYSSDTINLCCTDHPSKKEYYTYICNKMKQQVPQFKNSMKEFKIISNEKLIQKYNYKMKFSSPLTFKFK